jgi:hypothetical protein
VCSSDLTQQEAARMQLDKLRREEAAIETMMQAITAKDGPSDPWVASDAMIKSKVPQYMDMGFKMQESLRQNDRDRVTMGLPPLYGRPSAAPSAAPTSAAGAITGKTPTFPIAGKDVPMGTMGTGTFDTAQIGNIGLVAPQQPPVSAEDRAALVAAAGPSGLANALRQPSQGPYTGLTLEQNRAYFQAPLEERAALERALPSMKIPGVSAGQVPPFLQLSRDLLSPETRAAQDLGYGPAAQANALAPAATAPSTNAMLAPAAQPAMPPAGVQLASAGGAAAAVMSPEERRAREMLLSSNAGVREAGKAELAKLTASHVISPGGTLTVGGKPVFTAPPAPAAPRVEIIGVAKGTDKTVYFDKNTDAQFTIGVDALGKQVRVPYTGAVNRSTSSVTVTGGKQESAFETGLGKGQSERILTNQVVAQEAASIIDTVNTGRQIMQAGMITGAGAEFLVNLNQALKTVGIDSGYADAAANSQAFAANMANNVGRLIKQFGAGTGLSNADREYAEKMAGSKITLDAKAINRILDINERAARNVIARHNRDVKGIKTNIPLTVEEPPPRPDASATAAPPQPAVDFLRANPTTRAEFDKKYGAGAAARALGGQ